MSSKIQQHIYTRARQTMFQKTEGYGTVAVSPGLEESFIKKYIYPYCTYPTITQKNEISPTVTTYVNLPCGRLLLGTAVRIDTDFTRQRSTFFVHQYILPPNYPKRLIENIGMIKHLRFLTSYDANQPMNELEWDDLHWKFGKTHNNHNASEVIHEITSESDAHIHLDENLLAIRNAVFSAVKNSKPIYIISPTCTEKIGDFAYLFMTKLYKSLPFDMQHTLGFCTYSNESISKKGIHVIFIEKSEKSNICARFSGCTIFDMSTPPLYTIPHNSTTSILNAEFISNLPPTQFFLQMDFWHARLTEKSEFLSSLEHLWMAAHMQKLSASQFASIPDKFLSRGLKSKNAFHQTYLVFLIAKTCATAITNSKKLDLRYLVGSYSLDGNSKKWIASIVNRFYEKLER